MSGLMHKISLKFDIRIDHANSFIQRWKLNPKKSDHKPLLSSLVENLFIGSVFWSTPETVDNQLAYDNRLYGYHKANYSKYAIDYPIAQGASFFFMFCHLAIFRMDVLFLFWNYEYKMWIWKYVVRPFIVILISKLC